jgi:hypothetical protein
MMLRRAMILGVWKKFLKNSGREDTLIWAGNWSTWRSMTGALIVARAPPRPIAAEPGSTATWFASFPGN